MRSWFGRRRARSSALALLDGEWRCATCGELHRGLMDIANHAPDPWPGERVYEPNAALRLDGDFLSEDFCVLEGTDFLVRAVLEIPVHGLGRSFGYGCWTTLSRANFEKYVDAFDTGGYADWGPWTGWLCNRFADYVGTQPEAVWVQPRAGRQRPLLTIMDGDHPLAIAQARGVSPERMLEILALCGHGAAAEKE